MTKLPSILTQRRRQSLLALAVFAILATLLLQRALLPAYTLLPLNLIQSIAPWDQLDLGSFANSTVLEPLFQLFPNRAIQTAAIQNGQIPLWNPTILAGSPNVADPNFQSFYLPNLITAAILPVQHALPWLAWGHLILTGWFMYGFLRQQRLHWLASVLGGGIWILNAQMVVWLENPVGLSTLAWLPGIFWAYQKAVDERRLDIAALGGLLFGLAILGGQMQFVFAGGLALVIYALSRMVWAGYKQGKWSAEQLFPVLVIGLIGLGLGAITLLPAGALAVFSQRIRYTPESINGTRYFWQHLVTLIAPGFNSEPVNSGGGWIQSAEYVKAVVYFGAVSLLLALMAPLVTRRRQFTFSTIVLTILVFGIVLGTFLTRILFLFPGAQFVELTSFLFLIPLCGCWLAAIGLDGWLADPTERRKIVAPILLLLVVFAVTVIWSQTGTLASPRETRVELVRSGIFLLIAAGLLLAVRRQPRVAGSLLVLLAFVELLQWGWNFKPITSTSLPRYENNIVEYLRQDATQYRVLPLQSKLPGFGPNALSTSGIQTIDGYMPLIQKRYSELYKTISDEVGSDSARSNPDTLATRAFTPTVGLLNVKYILSSNALPANDMVQVDQMGCDSTVNLDDDWTTQSFVASEPGLNRIDILLAPRAAPDEGLIKFRLWRDDIGGDLVAETEISLSSTDTPNSHTVYFAPVADSAGQPFVWGVTGDQNTSACVVGPDQDLAFIAFGTQLITRAEIDNVWIYEVSSALPRAYLVHHAELVPKKQLLERLVEEDFDYHHSILLTTPLPENQRAQLADRPTRPQGQVEILDYDFHNVDLNVVTGQPAILVLADANYDGWQVTVNGSKQDIFEANGLYRGLFLPAGNHAVSFQYRPPLLYMGAGLAVFSITFAAILFFFQWQATSDNKSHRVWIDTIQLRGTHLAWLLFIAGILVIFWREPLFFLEPRLWAEEGTSYFATAYRASTELWHKGVLNIFFGYLALWPNIASAVAANLVPVTDVPSVMTFMAFLVQLIPLALIIWSKAEFWASPARRITGVLIYLLTPLSGEIWLNTINSQFYLALTTFLILIEPADNGTIRKWAYRLLLALACLTGPVSGILAPVYVLSAWLSKERERAIQAVIVAAGAAIQLLLMVGSSTSSTGVRLVDWHMGPLVFSLWTQSIGLLFGGIEWMEQWASTILAGYDNGVSSTTLYWIGLLVVAALLFWWLTAQMSPRYRLIFLGSYSLILIVSFFGSLETEKAEMIIPGMGGRYYWVPNVIIGFMLMANIFDRASSKLRRWLCTVLLVILLLFGATSYRQTTIASWEWPQWRTEALLWQADPTDKIGIWPEGWELDLE